MNNPMRPTGLVFNRDATVTVGKEISDVQEREFSLELDRLAPAGGDASAKPKLRATISSPTVVPRFFGREKLIHTADAVDLSRAVPDGLPMHVNHDAGQFIGRVRNVKLEGDKLRGELDFSPHRPDAAIIESEVRDGYQGAMSIRYRILEHKDIAGSDLVEVTRWMPLEASIVTVPADASAGVGRTMARDDGDATGGGADAGSGGAEEGARAENARQAEIRARFAPWLDRGPAVHALLERALGDVSVSADRAATGLLDLLGADAAPLGGDFDQGARGGITTEGDRTAMRATAGRDAGEKFHEAAVASILVRAGVGSEEDQEISRHVPYASYTLRELCREALRIQRRERAWQSPMDMVGDSFERAVGVLSHGTGDYPGVLYDTVNKQAMRGFQEAPATWRVWTRNGAAVDYRTAQRVATSEITDLEQIVENEDYPLLDQSDVREPITVHKYGGRIGITREAIVNDDLALLTRKPIGLGQAAQRVPGDLAYNILINGTTNTLNQDSKALFHADHNNYVAPGSGAAPTVTTVNAARVAMGLQTGPQGATLGIIMAFLLVPLELEDTARILQMAEYDPAGTAGTLTPNTVRNNFVTVADHRLSTADAAAWYVAGNPNQYDTVEVAFLNGRQAPTLETNRAWSRDGVEWKVRLDVGASPLDFRALYKNDGN